MTRINHKITVLILILVLSMLLPSAAFAYGPIDTEQKCSLTLHYLDGDAPIKEAKFSIYHIADVSHLLDLSLTGDFADAEKYPISLDCPDDAAWMDLAATLKGAVQKYAPAAAASGATGEDGSVKFDNLLPGLYLVLGERAELGYFAYTATPIIVFLPNRNDTENTWEYDTEANVKYVKTYDGPEEDLLSRKVLKVWNDDGKKKDRPDSVTVELLCDGKVYSTVTLSENNNWRYTWNDLRRGHDWTLVETPISGYTVTVVLDGITFKVTNTPGATPPDTPSVPPVTPPDGPYASGSVPVMKRITGAEPTVISDFTFVLMAKKSGDPMPAGSLDGVKELTISGAGSGEFGPIYFTEVGVYEYALSEKYGGVSGYTYDTSVYTVRFEVTEVSGDKLVCKRSIIKSDGSVVEAAEFNNPYKVPPSGPPILPQTGMLWWPVPVLLCAGLLSLLIGISRRRRHE